MEHIKYPAVTFSGPSVMEVCMDENELKSCNMSALKSGYFVDLIIIDSKGRRYIVNSAKKIGTVGPLFGFNLFRGQQIAVELDFKTPTSVIDLETMKELVFRVFRTDEFFWNSGGTLREIKHSISEAKSIAGVIKVLASVLNE